MGGPGNGTLREALDATTRREIEAALEATGGQKTRAARRLGISRQGLRNMMIRLGIGGSGPNGTGGEAGA